MSVTIYKNLDQIFETDKKTYIFSKTYMKKLAKKFDTKDDLNLKFIIILFKIIIQRYIFFLNKKNYFEVFAFNLFILPHLLHL